MRFPIAWITLAALCVVLCAIDVNCGPVDHHEDQRVAALKDQYASRTGRQDPYDDDSEEIDNDDEEGDDDGGDDGDGDDDDGEDEERSLKRSVRDAMQKPLLVNEETDEDSVIPNTDAPSTEKPKKKPQSMLLLLNNALNKAIAATTKLPTQQMASEATSVFLLLGQFFSEAIDKVIGEDDPEEDATEIGITNATENPAEGITQLPIMDQPVKVDKQPEIDSSQSDMAIASS